MRKHREAARARRHATEPARAAQHAWDEAVALGEHHGHRNAQATVLAPTGTISFLMDCDTTGIEPDFSLVKMKELVGGGKMTIVNRTVPRALSRLGYSAAQIDQIEAHLTTTARSSARPSSRRSTYRCSTWPSASARSRTWATSR